MGSAPAHSCQWFRVHARRGAVLIVASLLSVSATDAAMTYVPEKNARYIIAANDNAPGGRRVRIAGIHSMLAVGESEVEIFDALISNIPDLIANDNGPADG